MLVVWICVYLMVFGALWEWIFQSKWGGGSYFKSLVVYVPIGMVLSSLGGRSGEIAAAGLFAMTVAVPLNVLLDKLRRQQKAKAREAAAVAEAKRQALLAEEAQRQLAAEQLARKATEEAAARRADEERAALEQQRALAKAERERSGAEKALQGHVEVITSAVRSIRRDGDNAVLINTIDSELKAIARNERITEAMLTHVDLKDDIGLIAQMLAERGVDDKILLNRLRKVFRIGDLSMSHRLSDDA